MSFLGGDFDLQANALDLLATSFSLSHFFPPTPPVRFSRKPIRMTGRVVSSKDGAVRGSSRFIMALRRVKGGAIDNIM